VIAYFPDRTPHHAYRGVAKSRRDPMRSFLAACFTVAVVAVAAAAVLNNVVQQSSTAAFTESSARF
jgi:hypothetical protein